MARKLLAKLEARLAQGESLLAHTGVLVGVLEDMGDTRAKQMREKQTILTAKLASIRRDLQILKGHHSA